MTLLAGEEFAGYTIVRQIGSGGMGEVYLAQHPRLPRQEALKVLRPEISNDETFRQRFIREADSIAALEHPHIVNVHDRGDTEDRLWIATQYVDGVDAAQLLRDRYPAGMPTDEAVAITAAIADALDHAHDRGLLHRDVKPANILLAQPDRTGTRRIYLADFGIARPLDDPSGLTSTNFTLGTFAYAAPEQLVGKEMDGRADQYALAATSYHLLTGTTLYPDSNPVAVIGRHLTESPPLPSSIRTDLAPLDDAFKRALSKDPSTRFPSCREFARTMTNAAAQIGISATAATQQAEIKPQTPSKLSYKRKSGAFKLAAPTAFIGLGAGSMLLWHPWTEYGPTPATPSISTATTPATPMTAATTSLSPDAQPSAPAPPTPRPVTPAGPAYPSAGALGSACPPPGGSIGTGPDGGIYYCSRVQYTDGYEWSLTQGVIPNTRVTMPTRTNPVPSAGQPCPTVGAGFPVTGGIMQCNFNLSTLSGEWGFIPG